jgi:hypothetical protein
LSVALDDGTLCMWDLEKMMVDRVLLEGSRREREKSRKYEKHFD